jgi:hypothetical protein
MVMNNCLRTLNKKNDIIHVCGLVDMDIGGRIGAAIYDTRRRLLI